jgi:hypothetical protein
MYSFLWFLGYIKRRYGGFWRKSGAFNGFGADGFVVGFVENARFAGVGADGFCRGCDGCNFCFWYWCENEILYG